VARSGSRADRSLSAMIVMEGDRLFQRAAACLINLAQTYIL
jgi:hypothetical protein